MLFRRTCLQPAPRHSRLAVSFLTLSGSLEAGLSASVAKQKLEYEVRVRSVAVPFLLCDLCPRTYPPTVPHLAAGLLSLKKYTAVTC
jgi:hypothetical protein